MHYMVLVKLSIIFKNFVARARKIIYNVNVAFTVEILAIGRRCS
jgi:hypothetical protein